MTEPEYIEQDCGYETPCWVWQRGRDKLGYGKQRRTDSQFPTEELAHRVYYRRFVGEIPPGTCIDHLCRNRACVNPAHLEAVSQAKNVQRGALTKLTEAEVREIRVRLGDGDQQRSIAEAYGVDPTTVSNIAVGKSWRDVA